jgi:hypothetical protein
MGKKVVSLALFEPRDPAQRRNFCFTSYLPAVIRGHLSAYAGWELWIHHDSSLYSCDYGDTLVRLSKAGKIKLIYCGEAYRLCEAMLWRMKPIWEEDVEWVATRDVDAVPQPRDWRCLENFVANAGTVQVIHDSESHSGLMGGTACYNAGRLRARIGHGTWEQFRADAEKWGVSDYGTDQKFLKHTIKEADSVVRFPPREDPRDHIAPHIGGAGPAQPVISWYDARNDEGTRQAREYENAIPSADCYRHAVIASDESVAYMSFAPLTAMLWRVVCGYSTVLILVGKPGEWLADPRRRLVVEQARFAGAKIYWIDARGRRTTCVAQTSRLFAAALPIEPNPYLLTSDLDLWPCSRDWFWQQPMEKPWHQFFSNASGHQFYPIGYIGAHASEWKRVMRMSADLETETHKALREVDDNNSDDCWTFDERYYTKCIQRVPNYRGWWWELERHGLHDRIDRSRWPAAYTVAASVDAHCIRPAHERWGELRGLFNLLAPAWTAWADAFIANYRSLETNA